MGSDSRINNRYRFFDFISNKTNTASFSKITETLSKVSHNLDLLTKDLESSKSDRLMIHEELKKHDERLDTHAEKLVEQHTQQIKTLFRERRK